MKVKFTTPLGWGDKVYYVTGKVEQVSAACGEFAVSNGYATKESESVPKGTKKNDSISK